MKKEKNNKKEVKVTFLSAKQINDILKAVDDVTEKMHQNMEADKGMLTEITEIMKLFARSALIQYFNNSVEEIHNDIRKEISENIIKEKSKAGVAAKKIKVKKVVKKKINGKN